MPLLQRYILGELVRVFCSVLAGLTVLMVVGGVCQEVSQSGLGLFQTLQILPYIIPSLLPFSIPIAVLLTVCIVYGRLAAEHETTAAKAAGIPVTTLLWPALFLGGLLSAGSLLLTDQAIPWSVGNIRRVVTLAMEDIVLDMLKTQHELVLPQAGMSITVRGVEDRTLLRPIVRYTSADGRTLTAQARRASLSFELEEGRVLLALSECRIEIPGGGDVWLAEATRALPLPGSRKQTKPRHMSLETIGRRLAEVEQDELALAEQQAVRATMLLITGDLHGFKGPDVEQLSRQIREVKTTHAGLRTEMHGRIAFASSCFFFVLVGAPFAIVQARRQILTNFLICFLPITLLYYPLVILCMNQSKTGLLDPTWAMWIGNAVLLVFGLAAVSRCRRY